MLYNIEQNNQMHKTFLCFKSNYIQIHEITCYNLQLNLNNKVFLKGVNIIDHNFTHLLLEISH